VARPPALHKFGEQPPGAERRVTAPPCRSILRAAYRRRALAVEVSPFSSEVYGVPDGEARPRARFVDDFARAPVKLHAFRRGAGARRRRAATERAAQRRPATVWIPARADLIPATFETERRKAKFQAHCDESVGPLD